MAPSVFGDLRVLVAEARTVQPHGRYEGDTPLDQALPLLRLSSICRLVEVPKERACGLAVDEYYSGRAN
jgi:hypothetical protein